MTYYPAGKTSHENYGLVKNEEQEHEVFFKNNHFLTFSGEKNISPEKVFCCVITLFYCFCSIISTIFSAMSK